MLNGFYPFDGIVDQPDYKPAGAEHQGGEIQQRDQIEHEAGTQQRT